MTRKDRRQMFSNARRCALVAGGAAAAMAGVLGFAGSTASAEPALPIAPQPAPATVTQTITVQAGAPVAPAVAAAPATLPGQLVATPIAAPVETIVPASSHTLKDFFAEKHVALEAQKSADFKALNIVLPMPTGWAHVPDPNVPDAFAVIADRVGGDGLYTSNAALVVYKLVGEFDAKEAISHGLIDSQTLPAWRSTAASLTDYGGMPSAAIEGTYRENNMTLTTSRRHIIATSGPDRYLVTLSVTTSAQVSVASGDATDAIVNGFRVGSPDAPPPPAPAALSAPVAPVAPAAPAAPQVVGLRS